MDEKLNLLTCCVQLVLILVNRIYLEFFLILIEYDKRR